MVKNILGKHELLYKKDGENIKEWLKKEQRGLLALYKYGVDNFDFKQLCECPIEELDELEKYFIQKYDTFNNGYNLTLGGQGSSVLGLDEQKVILKYQELQYITDTAKFFNCSVRTISNILKKNNIKINTKPKKPSINGHKPPDRSKKIKIEELNLEFNSLIDCARWLIENGYPSTDNEIYVQKSISRVLRGDRKSYCKMKFSYIE
jgi:hypothetical protein